MKVLNGNFGLKVLVAAISVIVLAQVVPAGADEIVTLGYDRDVNVRKTDTSNPIFRAGLRVGTFFTAYYYRALVAVDLSTLPAYDEITSLTLRIGGTGDKSTVTAYAISQADGDWTPSSAPADLWDVSFAGPVGTYDADAGGWVFTGDLTALVDSWVSGENAGFMLIGVEEYGATGVDVGLSATSEVLDVGYTTIPEPATMAMLGLGGIMMLVRRRRNAA